MESTESTVTSVEASSGVKLCAAACIVPVVIIITLRAAELFEFYSWRQFWPLNPCSTVYEAKEKQVKLSLNQKLTTYLHVPITAALLILKFPGLIWKSNTMLKDSKTRIQKSGTAES